jgi:TIR domain
MELSNNYLEIGDFLWNKTFHLHCFVLKIFFCYAREDEGLLKKLKNHLLPLQHQEIIDMWHDRDISAGTEWKQAVDERLSRAHIILLLVSPDFMASDYCYGIEMKQALQRHQKGDAKVIPIILRPVSWQDTPLGVLQALPRDGIPVIDHTWHSIDYALYDVEISVKKAIKLLQSSFNAPVPSISLSQPTPNKQHATEKPNSPVSSLGGNRNYYVYEDDPTNKAKIHMATCPYCRDGKGIKATRLQDNRWHGPFTTLQEAEKLAYRLNKKNTERCKTCKPL